MESDNMVAVYVFQEQKINTWLNKT